MSFQKFDISFGITRAPYSIQCYLENHFDGIHFPSTSKTPAVTLLNLALNFKSNIKISLENVKWEKVKPKSAYRKKYSKYFNSSFQNEV